MKIYYTTSQPGIIHDSWRGFSFASGSTQHTKMLAEISAGTSQLLPWPARTYADNRRDGYNAQGLSAEGWLEALVEFLGTLDPKPPRFAELWAKREAVRAAFPKP